MYSGDRTLENLLRVLIAKFDLCARLPVYEYEAASEGHPGGATTFHRLSEDEREAIDALLQRLHEHLHARVGSRG